MSVADKLVSVIESDFDGLTGGRVLALEAPEGVHDAGDLHDYQREKKTEQPEAHGVPVFLLYEQETSPDFVFSDTPF